MVPYARQLIVSIFLLALLQEFSIVLCQRKYSEVGDPFGAGVRYSNSRVASTVTRRYPVGTNATEKPNARYFRPITTTTTERPVWTTPETDDALWWATSSTSTTTDQPRKRTPRKKTNHESLADWRNRFAGTYKNSRYPVQRPTTSTTEYTIIEKGSYFDSPNASAAPAKLVATSTKPFNWNDRDGRRHRHRHHHNREDPERNVDDQHEFESRGATTFPPSVTRAYTYSTPGPSYVRPSTVDPSQERGSVWYYNKKDKPPITHQRSSESVTYVSGSYFPNSNRFRKPTAGYFISKNEVDGDENTPSPQILTYPTQARAGTIRIRYFPGGLTRISRTEEEDIDSVHPFASVSGK